MKRRDLLKSTVAAGVVAAATVTGAASTAAAWVGRRARTLRMPANLLARMRRRTRPLRDEDIDLPHDLAG